MKKIDFKENTRSMALTIAPALAIIALVLTAYLWYAVLLPQRDLIAQLEDRCETGRRYVLEVSDFVRERPDYENYLKELDKKLTALNDLLPSESAFSEFLQEAESIARATGVAVVDIKPLAAVQKNGWRELPLEIIVTGNFEELLEFSREIESSRRFVSITAATISRGGAGQDAKAAPELESKISLVIYSSK